MGTFQVGKSDYKFITQRNRSIKILKKEVFDRFSEDILGLGEIQNESIQKNALSVIFDLEGFTNFCQQIDPQLAVPEYLYEFLKWIFLEVKNAAIEKKFSEGYKTWSSLPFLSKYLGDGILFLWDTEGMSDASIRNVVVGMYEICQKYTSDFLPKIAKKIISPPKQLRCGIARGAIYSVGNGNDFVGPCINMSSRLQKLHSLSFCFSRRGIDPEKFMEVTQKLFITKKVIVRGIGHEELVCVLKKEYDKLDATDKENFIAV